MLSAGTNGTKLFPLRKFGKTKQQALSTRFIYLWSVYVTDFLSLIFFFSKGGGATQFKRKTKQFEWFQNA